MLLSSKDVEEWGAEATVPLPTHLQASFLGEILVSTPISPHPGELPLTSLLKICQRQLLSPFICLKISFSYLHFEECSLHIEICVDRLGCGFFPPRYFEGVIPLSPGLRVLMRTQMIFVSCHPAYRSIFSPPLAAFSVFSFLLPFNSLRTAA